MITCEHCGKPIPRGQGLELREGVGTKRDSGAQFSLGHHCLDFEFCNLPCLTGWAQAQGGVYGYLDRLPDSKTPIVAIVFDADGNPGVRAAGRVNVVWVDERQPHDRVFETTLREPLDELAAFLGPADTWGHSDDARQERLAVQMEHAANGLRVVKPDDGGQP